MARKKHLWTRLDMSCGWAAGEIISNVSDLHQYITALTDGTFLSSKLQKERMTSWVKLGTNKMFPSARYDYNVFLFGGFIGHNGGLPGYISYMVLQGAIPLIASQKSAGQRLKNFLQIIF